MKEITKEDYIHSVYKVIFYIEANYAQDLTLDELAKVAGFSKYHFHRIFRAVSGENVGDYIRRIRLQGTTWKLKIEPKITQIALDSGYETNASFTKAFKKHFGMSPRAFSDQLKAKQGVVMVVPKVVNLEPITVLYVRKTGLYATSACEAWNVLMPFAYEQKMKFHKKIMDKETMHFGIGHDNPNLIESDLLRYDACISCDDSSIEPKGEVFRKVIDSGKFAVFLHKGAYENLKATYDEIGQ